MAIEVRDARLDDKPRCLDLLAALSSATGSKTDTSNNGTFEKLLHQERGQIIVAVEGETVLGMATVSYNLAMRHGGEYCQLEELIVDPRARGKNIGGLLVRQTVDNAKARGCAEHGLYLIESTEHNRAFYEKYGFVALGTEMRQGLD
jgi:GNAT superfamily N-acetyltransferase